MFENIAAIDIGTSSVKLLTLKTGLRNFQVTSMSYEEVDFGAEDPSGALLQSLLKLLDGADIEGHTVISNLPMEKTVIRNITFPFDDVEKIAAALPYEAEENIPFKLEDLVIDFQSLRSPAQGQGRIMLAAASKDTIRDFVKLFHEAEAAPLRLGLESSALFECYRYFNQIPAESIIQLDMGNTKTIINIISDNHLLYTRCIGTGVRNIHDKVSRILHIPAANARALFESLNLDLTSLENNYARDLYKTLKLSRQQLKKIFDSSTAVVEGLIEQIVLTLKSFTLDFGEMTFSRLLLSGGGANVPGMGFLLSQNLDLPVVSLPFLQDYSEGRIQTQFPTVFGTALSYLNKKNSPTNFLKGEFLPGISGKSAKIYYLAGAFAAASVLLLLVNVAVSSFSRYRANSQYREVLNERYMRYFHARQPSDDPVKAAMKMVADERKELGNLDSIMQQNAAVLDVLKEILTHFPRDAGFQLNNLVITENAIRIDGTISSSRAIDDFKNKLVDSRKYDSVDLNTNITKRNEISFALVIKQKTPGGTKKDHAMAID